MFRILFAEDEAVLGKLVKEALEREPDFSVHWTRNGQEALQQFRSSLPDLCILDVMMPVLDGFSLARMIRTEQPAVPILFLTARAQTSDVVKGFESGGNDYLKKPFSVEELIVRVRELLRRHQPGQRALSKTSDSYSLGIYTFTPATHTLQSPGGTYKLSHKETELLKELVLHRNNLMERKAVLLRLWGDDNFFNARNMDVYIARLRKYLAHDSNLSIINIRGFGFKLVDQSA